MGTVRQLRHRIHWSLRGAGWLMAAVVATVVIGVIVIRHSDAAITPWSSANMTAITSGSTHSCGIDAGKAYCWGNGLSGQLGSGSSTQSLIATPVATSTGLAGKTVTAISAGGYHTCAIASGTVYCWGLNTNGQLGNGTTTKSQVPVAVNTSGVLAGKAVTGITVGAFHSCAIADSRAYCWGLNSSGQLGNGSTAQSSSPVEVTASGVLLDKTVTTISAGSSHTCVAASNLAYCWGNNGYGQLGNNSTADSNVPVAVDVTTKEKGNFISSLKDQVVIKITAGSTHTCAIAGNKAHCWGNNTNGQLGNNSTTQSLVPVFVSLDGIAGNAVSDISAGTSHSCVVAANNAYCWGNNTNGQLGNNSTTQSLVPVFVDDSGVLSGRQELLIAAGSSHTCVISDSISFCWGSGAEGRLGSNATNDTTTAQRTFVAVPLSSTNYRLYENIDSATPGAPLAALNQPASLSEPGDAFRLRMGFRNGVVSHWSDISTSITHTCGISAGKAYCWGDNNSGKLGTGSLENTLVPTEVISSGALTGKIVTDISAGSYHTCAVAGGQAFCWGNNNSGRLGTVANSNTSVPTAVNAFGALSGKVVTDISAGDSHTCAIADGQAFCWGYNLNGRLGDGTTLTRTAPAAVARTGVLAGKVVTDISAGTTHSCATADGQAFCWGMNTNGRLGNGATAQSTTPVAVNTSSGLLGKTVTSISAGAVHSCAVASQRAYCWGGNFNGQLGNNTTTESLTPVAVDTSGVINSKSVQSISSSNAHTCAMADQQAYCWGANAGRLGNNSATQSATPVAVATSGALSGTSIVGVSSGFVHTCAVASHAIYCWGGNSNGVFGDGTTIASNSAVAATPVATKPGDDRTVMSNSNSFKLQYALKTAVTCERQINGFTDVTATSAIAWYPNSSVTTNTPITQDPDDPTEADDTVYQHYIGSGTTFTNSVDVAPYKNTLWDFSLKHNTGSAGAHFCLKMTYENGEPLEQFVAYPEIIIPAGSVEIGFVDFNGSPISNPAFAFEPRNRSPECQTAVGYFGSYNGDKLLVTQQGSVAGSWSVSIAPTGGRTALWESADTGAYYDFNDPSGSPAGCNSGSDGDGYAGQLAFGLDTVSFSPLDGCSTAGLMWSGDPESFSDGVVDQITLISGSSAQADCGWLYYGPEMYQTIPGDQSGGDYRIELTATVVAQ